MANQFLGQLMLVGFNFAPRGWAQCAGQILPISQNTALFSLLGTYYGGNGTNNFALPNLQGRCALGMGQGAGLSAYDLGQMGGSATATLTASNIPAHTHTVNAVEGREESGTDPAGNTFGKSDTTTGAVYNNSQLTPGQLAAMSPATLAPAAGGNLPHNNMMPYLTLNWVIALNGVFPPRS